jgi:hypothetical protein
MVTDVVIDASNVYVAGHIGGALPGEGQTATAGFQAFVLGYNPVWPHARLLRAQFSTAHNVLVAQLAENAARDLYLVGSTAGSLPGQTLSGPSDAFIIKVR